MALAIEQNAVSCVLYHTEYVVSLCARTSGYLNAAC